MSLPAIVGAGTRGLLWLQLLMATSFFGLQLFWLSQLVAYTRTSGLGGKVPDDALTWDKGWSAEEA